ncbi:CD63 antigen-like [Euwallacea similis]|uniref:CD63 antigen-like n=1 Tax=Euwallacea similis TaxID=1736056 RepID=UPI00344F317F
MESCGMNFIKYLLFIFNLVFAISGLGIIIAGGLVLADVSDFKHFTTSDLLGPPIVLIVAGSIVFIIAFLGCFGAIKESYNLLLAFAGLLAVIFVIELAVGIAAAVYKGDFEGTLKNSLRKSMNNYTNKVEQVAWDNLQKKIKCCGVDKPQDWESTPSSKWPKSCCYDNSNPSHVPDNETPLEDDTCKSQSFGTHVYNTGCFKKVKGKIEGNTKVLIGVGIGIAFVEIVGIILACWLAYTIKKEKDPQK